MLDNPRQSLEDYKAFRELKPKTEQIDKILFDTNRVYILYLTSLVNAKVMAKEYDEAVNLAKILSNSCI